MCPFGLKLVRQYFLANQIFNQITKKLEFAFLTLITKEWMQENAMQERYS